jgi:hypothetical protein
MKKKNKNKRKNRNFGYDTYILGSNGELSWLF